MEPQEVHEHDELDALFVDRQKADYSRLAKIGLAYFRLYSDTKEFVPTEQWKKLSNPGKILTYLLAKKVLRIKELITVEEEYITPKQIEAETNLPGGSIRPVLGKLLDQRLVRVDKSTGGYYVPDFAVSDIEAMLQKDQSA